MSRPIDTARILSCLDELAAKLLIQRAPTLPWNLDQEQRLAARASGARAAARRARRALNAGDAAADDSAHPVGHAVLSKPLSRDEVARALETCNVRLPADPRRH